MEHVDVEQLKKGEVNLGVSDLREYPLGSVLRVS
jgi:hypothetical protein